MLQVFYTVVFENRNQNASLWRSKMWIAWLPCCIYSFRISSIQYIARYLDSTGCIVNNMNKYQQLTFVCRYGGNKKHRWPCVKSHECFPSVRRFLYKWNYRVAWCILPCSWHQERIGIFRNTIYSRCPFGKNRVEALFHTQGKSKHVFYSPCSIWFRKDTCCTN